MLWTWPAVDAAADGPAAADTAGQVVDRTEAGADEAAQLQLQVSE